MATVFAGLEEFAGRFPALAGAMVQDVATEVIAESARRGKSAAEALSPRASGDMAGGWRQVGEARSAVESLQPVKIINTAGTGSGNYPLAYPMLISQGRRQGPSGRMLGSTSAPRGIKGPVIGQLRRSEEDILSAAIARVESRSA